MSVTNPPGWLQNAGTTHTAVQLRQYITALQAANFSSATSLRSRGGVHPTLGQEFNVTQAGSPNMTVLVESGVASIPGTESGAQGNYFVCNDAQVTLSISAAHVSLPRIDIVVLNVRDQVYSGAFNDSQLQIITGTPAASPAVPTAPANSITVAQVAVGAGVTSILNANITDTRYYLAGVGGVINCRTDATRPASGEIAEGQLVWVMATNILYVWDGAAYEEVYPGTWTTWTPSLTNLTQGSGTITARYLKRGKTLDYKFRFIYGAGSAVGTSPRFTLPFTPAADYTSVNDVIGYGTLLDSGFANRQAVVRLVSGSTVEVFDITSAGIYAFITATAPWTWNTGDSIFVAGRIELA